MRMPEGAGIVLAAGRSARMGRPKALLRCLPGDETFVARVVRTLREGGLHDVLVVGRTDDRALRAELRHIDPAPRFVANPDPDRGQLSSLIAGIDDAAIHGAEAVVVLPVDMPQVHAQTVAAIVAALRGGSAAPILRAAHGGRHGHPVAFRQAVFDELRAADPATGAKAVLQANPARVFNVEVDDPGVLRDVDVPSDYEEMFDPG